jgi:hypothetical protein
MGNGKRIVVDLKPIYRTATADAVAQALAT